MAIPNLPTLRQLRHLTALAEHHHFGRAAAACFVTQSTLSNSLKELETVLGQTLVERTRRHVEVTPLGTEVVERANAVLRAVEDIVDLTSARHEPLAGRFRLGVVPSIAPFLLPRVLPTLRRVHPELKLYLREERYAPLADRLRGGEVDAMLLALPQPLHGLETSVFADDPLWAAVPRGHALTVKERVGARDLDGEELLILEPGDSLRDHVLRVFGAHAPRLSLVEASSLHTLVQMVANGLGVTVLPKMALDGGILGGTRVEARPLDARYASRQVALAWRPSSPRVEEFELLAGYFRDELATPLPRASRTVA